ncbi:MAG TPA: UTP--glucose-1-phosphate uridylyltransferase GalU [Clostridia bacterium]|jgi:UTP--glucose-1-phosphate uridylyltransferase|nr:UTP--glucose-1-phosphate uridylyltransferase GalU [Clostridia bacterium]
MKVRKAIIPAAGLGTRFLPATKAQPKEMLPIVDKPAIQYIIEEAIASGIEDILIVTGRNKRAIEDHFDRSIELEMILQEKNENNLLTLVREISEFADIHYIRQKETKGLGHAIYCARKFIGNEPFAVLLGDDIVDSSVPCLKQLLNIHEKLGGSVLGVKKVAKKDVKKYGIIASNPIEDSLYEVTDLVEKPKPEEAPSQMAVMGRYIIQPEIFDILAETKPGAGGEIQLTDALRVLRKKQKIYAYAFEGNRYDIGDKLGFLIATVEFALKREELAKDFKNYLASLNIY